METTQTTKAQPTDAGCWIDGHWGQYGPTRLIEIARDHGMVLDRKESAALVAHLAEIPEIIDDEDGERIDTFEWVIGQGGMADDAEEWLNEHIAPEGYSFGWMDGEFFLGSTEWWEEESP